MRCPKCGSENVNIQMVSSTTIKEKHHGIIWWLLFGWYWVPIKWIVFTIPALIFKIFAPKKYKIKNETHSVCVCQNCGHTWNAK
jgi:predicted nucleic-acid-binding Zn-ribbon protein